MSAVDERPARRTRQGHPRAAGRHRPRAVRARRLRGHLGRGRSSTRPGSRRARSITTSRTSPPSSTPSSTRWSRTSPARPPGRRLATTIPESLRAGCGNGCASASTPRSSRSPSSMPPPCSPARWRELDEQYTSRRAPQPPGLADSGRVPAAQVDALANMLLAAVGEAALLIVQADDPEAPRGRPGRVRHAARPARRARLTALPRAGWIDPCASSPRSWSPRLLAGCTIPGRPATRRCATATSSSAGQDRRRPVRHRAEPAGQPGRPEVRLLPADRRHGEATAGRSGSRRRVLGRRQERRHRLGDRLRAARFAAVSLGYRLLATGPCGGTGPVPQQCYTAAVRGAARRPGRRPLPAQERDLPGRRPRPHRDGGRVGRAVTSLLVGWRPDDPGTSGNPGPPSDIRAAVSVAGGLPIDDYISAGDARAVLPRHRRSDRSLLRGRPATSARWPSAT